MISCSCGKAKKKSDPQYKACIDGVRKSKCTCLKYGWKCSNACDCYNCYNGETKPPTQAQCSGEAIRKRKRVNPSPYKRVKGTQYLENKMSYIPLQGSWTHIETLVLVNILSLLSTFSLSPSINDTTKLYNFIADYEKTRCNTTETKPRIRTKSGSQVSGKILHIQEIQEINEALLKN